MADTLRYSIQGSPLAPAGFVGNYGRLQVDLRPTSKTVVISATDYDDIAVSLSEGRSINLNDEKGRFMGQFTTGLSGGFDIATFTQATKADARISFKPSQELLASARATMTFEQVPTVHNDPQISDVSFVYDVSGTTTTIIDSISQTDSGMLRIIGTNFVKGATRVSINQRDSSTGIVSLVLLDVPINIGAKYIEVLLTATSLSTLALSSALPPGSWTHLVVFLSFDTNRQDLTDITII